MHRARVPIRKKCDQRWSDLRGASSKMRHCGVCDSAVVNLSSMTEVAAEDFLARVETSICLAYRYDFDGQILFAPEPVPPARLLRRAPTAIAAAAALSLAACEGVPNERAITKNVVPSEQLAVEPSIAELSVEHGDRGDDSRPLESAATAIPCDILRQIYALGGYGTEPPDTCIDEESGELVLTRSIPRAPRGHAR